MHNTIYVAGYPNRIGGAPSELWHTIKLWRRKQVPVTVFPTWKPDLEWKCRLEMIGCKTTMISPGDLRGEIVVALCNPEVTAHPEVFEGAKIVWGPCCSYLSGYEADYYRKHPLMTKYLFQSHFQLNGLWPEYKKRGVRRSQCHLIRGAFDCSEFPYLPNPHRQGGKFVLGRLSRSHPWKFATDTWEIYTAIRETIDAPVTARVMGFQPFSIRGPVPSWVEILPEGAESPQTFLQSLHAMVQLTHKPENWPRTGLEAMSVGVPIVVDDAGGWQEMIVHGKTGFLCQDKTAVVDACKTLAENEYQRMELTGRARERLEEDLANPDMIWANWKRLFDSL